MRSTWLRSAAVVVSLIMVAGAVLASTGEVGFAHNRPEQGHVKFAHAANRAKRARWATKARTLNGLMANQLVRAAYARTDDAPEDGDLLTTEITAPGPGILLVSAGVDAFNDKASDTLGCRVRVDGVIVTGSLRKAQVNGGTDPLVNIDEDCTTEAAHPVDKGQHTVTLEEVNNNSRLLGATLWALYVPFGGTGARP